MHHRTVSEQNSTSVLNISLENMIRINEGVIGQDTESEHKSKQGTRESGRESVCVRERQKAHDASSDRAHAPLCMTILGHRRSLRKNQEVVGHLKYHVTSSTIRKALPQ